MGKISRAQRYKKDRKIEQEELKICNFLSRNRTYIAPDTQNIVSLIAMVLTSNRERQPPMARSTSVRIMKKVRSDAIADLYVITGIRFGRSRAEQDFLIMTNAANAPRIIQIFAFSLMLLKNAGL